MSCRHSIDLAITSSAMVVDHMLIIITYRLVQIWHYNLVPSDFSVV